jgi:hypothetical protein
MPDVSVVATISWTGAGSVDGLLTLTTAPYEIDGTETGSGLDVGQVVQSRLWATSPYVAGAVQVLSVPGVVAATLKMFVHDTSQSGMQTDLTNLIDAFCQPSYTLTFTVGGAEYSWLCNNADYQIDPWPLQAVIGNRLGVLFDIPRQPIALAGPI